MKERLLTGWTFIRALYLVIGSVVIIESVMRSQWFDVALGGYFAAMGLFAFGCAAGSCFGGNCRYEPEENIKTNFTDVDLKK